MTIEFITNFLNEIGIPGGLRKHNVTETHIAQMVEQAMNTRGAAWTVRASASEIAAVAGEAAASA